MTSCQVQNHCGDITEAEKKENQGLKTNSFNDVTGELCP